MPDELALTIEQDGGYGFHVKLGKAYLAENDDGDLVLSEPDLGAPSPVHFPGRRSAQQAMDIFDLGFKSGLSVSQEELSHD